MSYGQQMVALRIRAGVAADIPLLAPIEEAADRVFVAAGHTEFSGAISDDEAAAGVAEGQITVIELLGTVVGWVAIGRLDDELCVEQISVHPDHHGHGIGSELMRHVMEQASDAGERSIILDTQSDVPWNQPWYEQLGFEVVPEKDWTDAMNQVAARQTVMGLNWQTRVHMRWRRSEG